MDKLIMIWSNFYFQSIFKIFLISVLAGIIGIERDTSHKPAGFRTYTLLGISAVLVVLCGESLAQKYSIDPFRIAAQFLSGIGFIGAGTILRDGFNVTGLTTASGLLTISCIGLCVGAGFYLIAIIATVITYIILSYSYKFTEKLEHFDLIELEISINDEFENFLINLEKILEKYDLELKYVKEIKDVDDEYNLVKLACKYNNRMVSKNKILTTLATLEESVSVNII